MKVAGNRLAASLVEEPMPTFRGPRSFPNFVRLPAIYSKNQAN